MLVATTYKDIPYEARLCEHIHRNLPKEQCVEGWETRTRGNPVVLDTATFKAGECANCDYWLIHPAGFNFRGQRICVIRGEVNVGD